MRIQTVLCYLFFLTQFSAHCNESPSVAAILNGSTPEERAEAFEALRIASSTTEPHYFTYCSPEEVSLVREVPASLYADIIQSMTISCVDIFVYDFERKAYLQVLRATEPVKGLWWFPGGRIFKGESFFQCAIRKTKAECGLDICPIAQLGTYSTYFLQSAWGDGVHTDTKNTVILALCGAQDLNIDTLHAGFKWVPIDEPPEDAYLLSGHTKARKKLKKLGFLQ